MRTTPAIETAVLRIAAEVLNEPAAAFHAQPVLAAHNWDSLVSLEAFAQLEGDFGVRLDLRAFHACRTVGDLAALVADAVTAAGGALPNGASPRDAVDS